MLLKIFGILLCWNFVGFLIGTCTTNLHLNPKKIYELHSVNIFGCVVLTIMFNLFCPVFSIGYWFYKLCTVGRKK